MRETQTMVPHPGSLPSEYEEILNWKLSDKRIRLIGVQLLVVPLFVIFGVVFSAVAVSIGRLPSRLDFGLAEVSVALASVVATLVVHELTHGVAMRLSGARPRYGVLWKQLMFYATSPGYAYRRNTYVQVALAPMLVLSLVAVAGMWLLAGTFWVAVVGLCAAINASGAIGDIWITMVVLRYSATAYVMDERDGVRVFQPR